MKARTRGGHEAPVILIRPYTDEDEAAALAVLTKSLGGGPAGQRSPEFFRWKHFGNPFGRSFILVAEAGDRIVGVRALMRWRFRAGSHDLRAVRAVDTATHPQWQGRGVFTRLTLEAIEGLREEADLVFNTPNNKSLPGYLKMGWQRAGKVPISVRVRRPVRFTRGARRLGDTPAQGDSVPAPRAMPASDALSLPGVEALVACPVDTRGQLTTIRDLTYMKWRYGKAPLLDYRAVVEERADWVVGLAIFRVRPRGPLWESTVCELIAARDDRSTLRRLLRAVAAAAPVDHVTCHFPPGSRQIRAARLSGFVPAPDGMTFVVNPLAEAFEVDPLKLGSWALSLGDLEVF
jgi:GNAT superfamily N-acetyltransferase